MTKSCSIFLAEEVCWLRDITLSGLPKHTFTRNTITSFTVTRVADFCTRKMEYGNVLSYPNLTSSASARAFALGLSTASHGDSFFPSRLVQLVRGGTDFAGSTVPIVDHLESENGIEDEAGNEAVKDKLVVDFLEGCEDAREGTEEVVENLEAAKSVWVGE
jgi:hypothetical protein